MKNLLPSWKNDIADAVLLVNHFMTIADDFVPGDPSTSPVGILRRVQTQLLEAYRQEINEPWNRFYVQKPIGGGNGAAAKVKPLKKRDEAYPELDMVFYPMPLVPLYPIPATEAKLTISTIGDVIEAVEKWEKEDGQ